MSINLISIYIGLWNVNWFRNFMLRLLLFMKGYVFFGEIAFENDHYFLILMLLFIICINNIIIISINIIIIIIIMS